MMRHTNPASKAIVLLSMILSAAQFCHGDLGESRDQIIARYGKPNIQTKDALVFRFKDAPVLVKFGNDGRSIRELYSYDSNVEQKCIMKILLRNSKNLPWVATCDYANDHVVWRYTQSDLHIRASYENNEETHDHVFYYLTVDDGK